MTLYLAGNEPFHLPEEEVGRFEIEYQDWLKSGLPCCEFIYDKGHTTHYVRYDAITRRETRHFHPAGAPPGKSA